MTGEVTPPCIPAQRAIDVYFNAQNEVVIWQEGFDGEDQHVVILPANVSAVIAALQRCQS